jgi:MFS family permease
MLIFGALDYVENKKLFFWLSFVFRFLTGISVAALSSVAYGYLPLLYPKSIPQKQVMLEIAFSMGMAGGSIIGKMMYDSVGYMFTFGIVGITCILLSFVDMLILPVDKKK